MKSVGYSKRSDKDTTAIEGYLAYQFTQKEIDNFYKLLERFEEIIVHFPELYPVSTKKFKIRRAVLSKQLSVFYRVFEHKISVVAVLDNRMDPAKWP
jgi:plasmid stabilization system protein ParE